MGWTGRVRPGQLSVGGNFTSPARIDGGCAKRHMLRHNMLQPVSALQGQLFSK
jgi:hypothetical protein